MSALTVDLNQATGGANPNGVINPQGSGTIRLPNPNLNLDPNANANSNINLYIDRNGNLVGENGLLPLNAGTDLLKNLPVGDSSSSSNAQASPSSTETSSNNTYTTSQPIMVYRSNVAQANNPYLTSQMSTANGNGTIVYYYIVTNPNGVQSQENLQNYTVYTVQNDENMEKAGINQNGMDLSYIQPARFLGFIPSRIPVDIHIGADGTVDTDYPWYSFLMDTNKDELEAAIKTQVDTVLNQDTDISGIVEPTVSNNVLEKDTLPATGSISGNDIVPQIDVNNVINGSGTLGIDIWNKMSPGTKAHLLNNVHNVLQTNILH
ncbi:MAG: hypothetical protein V4665_01770 [Patescibacteria group bacterium]